jgi:phenylpyruvate tautomerase PptA (4-oxalocrotonate tautomerase family)
MPLLIIHSLPPADDTVVARMLVDIRDTGARALNCSPDNVWVMFHALPPGCYVQGTTVAKVPQHQTHPPVVIAKLQKGRRREELDAFMSAIAAAVGRGLSLPAENVWIQYEEMRSEDVWFHGRWSA